MNVGRRAGQRVTTGLLSLGLAAGVVVPLAGVGSAAAATTVEFAGTLAGQSRAAMYPSGMEYDAVNDRLVVADTGGDRVLFYTLTGTKLGGFGDYGEGDGQFKSPRDVAVDEAGNIYVADAENNRIQKFTSDGTFLWKTLGIGTGDLNFNTPIGVTWDAANDVLLIASTGQNRIKALYANGTFAWKSPIIGGDFATVPAPNKSTGPRDVTRAPDGTIWVTAYKEHQIKVYDVPADGSLWTNSTPVVAVVGSGNGTGDGQMNFPYNAVFSADGNTAYVSDTGNGRITVWDISGPTPTWVSQIGANCDNHPQPCDDPPADTGKFNHLRRVVIDPAGNLYGADFWGGGIEVFDSAGAPIRSIEGMTAPTPGFAEPYGVDVAPDGQVYVMDRLNHRIQRFTAQGAFVNAVGARGVSGGTFSWPEALTVAPNGDVWAVDTRGDNIQKFPASLGIQPPPERIGSTGSAVGKFNYPEGADVDSSGVVWVADTRNNRLQKYDPANGSFSVVGSSGSGPGQLKSPMGVSVTSDAVYVADTGNNRVQKFSLNGDFLGQSALGLLLGPEGLQVAPDGTVWVADTGNSRMVHLSSSLVELSDSFGAPGNGDLQFDRPHDVAFGNGLLYVADTYNDRVQTFTVGDPPPPPPPFEPTYAAQLSAAGGVAPLYPAGVAVAGDGTWFVADSGGSRVATVDPVTGATSTVNATAFTDPRDLELDATDSSSLWVTNTGKSTVVKISRTGTVLATLGGTPALNQPYGLANDADRVYVANTYGGNVKAFSKSGGGVAWTQSTCDGKSFLRPRDVGLADNGNLLVADTDNARIVVLDSATGACLSSFGGNGTAIGKFKGPRSVTGDGSGGMWVADGLNYRIQHLSMTGLPIGSPAATPVDAFGETAAQFRSPHCIARLPGSSQIAVCDTFNYRLKTYAVDGGGTPTLDAIVGGQKPTLGGFNGAFAVAYGPAGELYTVDWFNHRIQKFNPDGTVDRQWGGYGPKDGSLIFPRGIVVAPNGDVVVTDSENNRIDVFDSTGTFKSKIKPPTGALQLARPHQTALDGSGGYWVADTNNSRIVRLSSTGAVLGSFTIGGKPQGVAVDTDGTLLVSNTTGNAVLRYNTSGVLQGTVVGSTTVKSPSALLVTGTGSEKKIWIADTGNHRIVVLGADGAVLKTFGALGSGDGRFNAPRGVAVDPTDGDIAVADYLNNRVSLWEPTGPPPVTDSAAPTIALSTPASGALTPSPVTISGLAADDLQVSSVTLGIKRTSDNQWWNGSTWQSTVASVPATLSTPNASSSDWSYVFSGLAGKYGFSATVTDGAGKKSKSAWRNFTISP